MGCWADGADSGGTQLTDAVELAEGSAEVDEALVAESKKEYDEAGKK